MEEIILKPGLFSRLLKYKESGGLEFFLYTPSLLRAFPFRMEKISAAYRMRCILEYYVGYKVFYIRQNGEWAGYCIVSNGRNRRYPFCTKRDITFGRYFVSPSFRGKGLGVRMVGDVLRDMGLRYEKAYAYVHRNNKASHATLRHIGCEAVGHFDKVGKLRKIVPNENGSYTLYCFEKAE